MRIQSKTDIALLKKLVKKGKFIILRREISPMAKYNGLYTVRPNGVVLFWFDDIGGDWLPSDYKNLAELVESANKRGHKLTYEGCL